MHFFIPLMTQAECKVMDRSRGEELTDRTLTFRIVEPTLSYASDGTIKDPLRMLFEYSEEGYVSLLFFCPFLLLLLPLLNSSFSIILKH